MNSELKDRVYDVPMDVLSKIQTAVGSLQGKNAHGVDRANKILKDRKVNYGQLKRIIHDIKTMDKVQDKLRYELYGGESMEKWANQYLKGERDLVRNKKQASAGANNNTGLDRKNPFLKKHTKKPQGVNVGIKSNSDKSVVSPITVTGLYEEIKRFKDIINY